jgi:hypothetical protein
MKLRFLDVCLVVCCFFSFLPLASAHGGGSLNNETCFVEMGDFHIGLVGYQPQEHPKDKFCDAYPSLGPTVLTFDFVDAKVRQMKTGVKIVEAKGFFDSAPVDSEGLGETIASEEPSIRSKGLMTIAHEFKNPGKFIALVSVVDDQGIEQTGWFPFTVGESFNQTALIVLAAAIGFLVFRLLSRVKRARGQPAT